MILYFQAPPLKPRREAAGFRGRSSNLWPLQSQPAAQGELWGMHTSNELAKGGGTNWVEVVGLLPRTLNGTPIITRTQQEKGRCMVSGKGKKGNSRNQTSMEQDSSLVGEGQSGQSEVKCRPVKPLPAGQPHSDLRSISHALLLCPGPCSGERGHFNNPSS